MFNFKEAAQKATVLSYIMEGRQKIDTANIVNKELTIIEADLVKNSDDTEYPCILFNEYPNNYYCGGMVLKKIVISWIESFGGDIEGMNLELAKSGGVKIKLTQAKTKQNNNLVKVEIL